MWQSKAGMEAVFITVLRSPPIPYSFTRHLKNAWREFLQWNANIPLESRMNWLEFSVQRSSSLWTHKKCFWLLNKQMSHKCPNAKSVEVMTCYIQRFATDVNWNLSSWQRHTAWSVNSSLRDLTCWCILYMQWTGCHIFFLNFKSSD